MTGPDGMPVSGVRPVCPSAKLSSPTVSRFTPAGVGVVRATVRVAVDDSDDGSDVGRPTACDTRTDADSKVSCLMSGVALTLLTTSPLSATLLSPAVMGNCKISEVLIRISYSKKILLELLHRIA